MSPGAIAKSKFFLHFIKNISIRYANFQVVIAKSKFFLHFIQGKSLQPGGGFGCRKHLFFSKLKNLQNLACNVLQIWSNMQTVKSKQVDRASLQAVLATLRPRTKAIASKLAELRPGEEFYVGPKERWNVYDAKNALRLAGLLRCSKVKARKAAGGKWKVVAS